MMAQAAVLPLGVIPYDNMVLPLVSPDGRFVATQSGVSPTWETVLADRGAEIPAATRIEIYELDRREGIVPKDRRAPALISSLDESAVLGRSCDAVGFLIESPREDGSRWIGKAAWRTGEIQWLVTGPDVNAFAAMGPAGRLAWSRRTVDAEFFDLVVRSGGAVSEWTISAAGEHWLFPTWSGPDRIFVFALTEGELEARYASVANPLAFRQSIQRFSISSGATTFTAYQAVNGQTAFPDPAARDRLVFFHPALLRMAIWRPLETGGHRKMHLNARSIAAVVDETDFALVATDDELIRQNLRIDRQRVHLAAGAKVPRATPGSDWPYLLLTPGESQIGVAAMRLLNPGQAPGAMGGR
jgi:hypothetical protein